MTNEFKDYYKTVKEHAEDMVGDMYNDFILELQTSSYGYSFHNWYSQNSSFLSEYNNYISISLREAVEIIEQSQRLVDDSALYVNSGDCREQVQAMAYWTYRQDLEAEFRIALKSRLEDDLPSFNADVEKIQDMIDNLQEKYDNLEMEVDDIQDNINEAIEENDTEKAKSLEAELVSMESQKEDIESQIQKLEEEMEEPSNLLENAEKVIGEIR
jgi:chromosome segregation protein